MKKSILILSLITSPLAAFAATNTVDDVLTNFMNIILAVSQLMAPLAMLFFFWQLIKFIRESHDGATTLAKTKNTLIYAGIILFVMVGIWTIVAYVQSSLGVSVTNSDIRQTPPIPRDVMLP